MHEVSRISEKKPQKNKYFSVHTSPVTATTFCPLNPSLSIIHVIHSAFFSYKPSNQTSLYPNSGTGWELQAGRDGTGRIHLELVCQKDITIFFTIPIRG